MYGLGYKTSTERVDTFTMTDLISIMPPTQAEECIHGRLVHQTMQTRTMALVRKIVSNILFILITNWMTQSVQAWL